MQENQTKILFLTDLQQMELSIATWIERIQLAVLKEMDLEYQNESKE